MIKHLPHQAKIDMASGVSSSTISKVYWQFFQHENEAYLEWLCKYYRSIYEKQMYERNQ